MKVRGRFVRSEQGAAMVEFAIVAPLLFMLILGTIDFGRALFVYNNLTNAAREGARLAAARATQDPASATVKADVDARVAQYISGFEGASPSYAVQLTTDVAYPGTEVVTVAITNFEFNMLTPFAAPIFGGANITMPTVSASFRWEGTTN